jgi:preprotein translocase subunit SecD
MTMNQRARTTGLAVVFILASAMGSAMAAPRAAADDAQEVVKIRATVAAGAEKALEKQGGSRLVFKVDADALHEVVVTDLRDDAYRILREGRIPFSGFAMREGGVEVRIADAKDRQKVLSKLVPSTDAKPSHGAALDVADKGDGLVRLTPTESGFAERLRGLVGQSMEMIEQRLRNIEIRQAGVQPDGPDRIRVLLPGIRDPEPVATLFGRRAQVAFRLVDVSMTTAQALQAPPSISEVLTDFKTKDPYLVQKEIAVEGDDIIDASPSFNAQDQPVASFRFNAHGTRRFAHITTDNIGRSFAIVFDDQVLSASVIQEPILGGSVVISGNFTLEEANTVAMLLRAGTLPGRLSVVDRQVVEAAGGGGKQ